MADSPNVFEVTRDSFQSLVIDKSHEVPVLVDFWAEWCGPCQMQLPVLLKLADDYGGAFVLAKVNTDLERELATRFNIRSIPTMKLFRNGEVVEDILGAQTESALRALLDRHIERESDKIREQALAAERAGDAEAALALLRTAAGQDPDNPRVQLDLARLATQQGQFDEAESVLDALPMDVKDSADAERIRGLLQFARAVADAPELETLEAEVQAHPEDPKLREQLAARYALAGREEEAMENYLHLLQHHRDYDDNAGRRGLLAMFALLGNEGELVSRYRMKMFNALH